MFNVFFFFIQSIHRIQKSTKRGPRLMSARFLRYFDREEVLQLTSGKLKATDLYCCL